MTIKADCQRLFKTDDLYKVLSLEKSDDLTEGKGKQLRTANIFVLIISASFCL